MARKLFVIGLALLFALPTLCLAQFTIINGSFYGSAPATIEGWDGIAVSGRENGPFSGSVQYQAINSPNDPETGSGSAIFIGESIFCSFTQQLGINANGQTLTVYADIAWDGLWDYIYFGFYEDTLWDRVIDASIDITLTVPADTDGTLDDFHTVMATGTMTTSGYPLRVYFGTSCDPWSGGPQQNGVSSFAVDRVSTEPPGPPPTPTPEPASAGQWFLYE